MLKLKTFYFTFGCESPLADFVQMVRAPDLVTARAGMFRYYHNKWYGCYDTAKYVSDGKCAIFNAVYKVLDKVITARNESEIECTYL